MKHFLVQLLLCLIVSHVVAQQAVDQTILLLEAISIRSLWAMWPT